MSIFTKLAHEREVKMAKELKEILDPDANFVRPLSEFWKGCTKEQTLSVGHYGLWLSGEGGSMIDGDYAAYYYDKVLNEGHKKLKDFMIKWNLKLRWHDCGTPILIPFTDEI
jgi:hypothetical protein